MRSIRSKFTSLTAISIIISVVAVGVVSMHYIRAITREYLEELLMLKCVSIEEDLDTYLNSIEQCVDTVAYYASEEMTGNSDEELDEYIEDVQELFNTTVKRNDGIISYYYRIAPEVSKTRKGFRYTRNKDGRFEYVEPADLHVYDHNNTTRMSWYYTTKENGYAGWIEPYENEDMGGVTTISYVAPVYSKSEFVGVIGVDYDFDILRKHIQYNGHFERAYTFLTNDYDVIIYHPDLETGTSVADISESLTGNHLSDNQKVLSINYNDETQRVTWRPLANNMRLYLVVPENSYKVYWFKFARAFAASTALLLILFVTISLAMSKRISKPLTELTEAALQIDEGNYDVDLRYSANDEIGVLTRTFRQLIGHLRAYISDLNDMAYKDALTSVKNKGALDMYMQKLEDRIQVADYEHLPRFAICMFDCNWLKSINDTYGHDKGDVYLKRACSLICDVFRHSPVFRLGGDEFVCILQNEDYDNRIELCMKFDRLTVTISEDTDNEWEKISVASGIAVFNPARGDRTAAQVYKRSDQRMYEDKERKKLGIIRELTEDMLSY